MQIGSMDVVIVTDSNCCLYIIDGDILVNAPDEGSEDLDHMFGQISEVVEIIPMNHELTQAEVLAKWPLIMDSDFV